MRCEVCGEEWPDAEGGLERTIDHIRVMHPDQYEGIERWPDGGIVIHDNDPDPGDYGATDA